MAFDVKKPTITVQSNRRHILATTQFILIAAVYVISFIPTMLVLNDVTQIKLLLFFYYINHVSNFFIYLTVSSDFRKEAKNLLSVIIMKARPDNATRVFILQ